MEFKKKKSLLHERLRELSPFVLAFSAGKDSAFLLKEALAVLGKKSVFPVFVDTALITDLDRERLLYFQKRLKTSVIILKLDPVENVHVQQNNADRCYHCKKMLFGALLEWSEKNDLPKRLLDGSTFSDINSYRPGARAINELKVISPLKESGITSQEIVGSMRTWRVPARFLCSSSCLATRVPYGQSLESNLLRRIEKMESFWHQLGIFDVRCRVIADGCRVEVPLRWQQKVVNNREGAVRLGKTLGFNWVALDLDAIRSGPWDPVSR